MKKIKIVWMSVGVVLIILGVMFLSKFVSHFDPDFEFLSDTLEDLYFALPHLLLGSILGILGSYLFLSNLLSNEQ
jgi:hypothetical protein